MGTVERSFDAEIVTTPDFDPASLVQAVVAKAGNQENVFISRVLGKDEMNENARPGIEIYLKKKGRLLDMNAMARQVSEAGIDGFTMIVDERARVAGMPDEFIGIRYQYVPEFSGDKNWTSNTEGIRRILRNLADAFMSQEEVAFANVVKYDTLVIGKESYGEFNTGTGGALGRRQEHRVSTAAWTLRLQPGSRRAWIARCLS